MISKRRIKSLKDKILGPRSTRGITLIKANIQEFGVSLSDTEVERRAEIVGGKRPMTMQNLLSDYTQVSNLPSDSQIMSRNRALIRAEAYKEANESWKLGKKFEGNEDSIIQLVDMEDRDGSQFKKGWGGFRLVLRGIGGKLRGSLVHMGFKDFCSAE